MLVALGWMLLAGLPVPGTTQTHMTVTSRPAASRTPVGRVTIWTDRDEPYRRGQGARVYLSADDDAHLAVFRVDTDGRLRVLFPHEPWGDTFVPAGRTLEVSGLRGGRSFMVDDDPGIGYLLAVASPDRLDFDDITRGDWWDYRLIDGGRLRGDPYVLLVDLAQRITRGADYHYDIAPYYVGRHYDYPRFVCYDCHAVASYDEWDPYDRACRRFRLEIYADASAYPYRQGRGRDVVAPGRGIARYVFRDADPRRDYVTRVPKPREAARGEAGEPVRGAEDVGGRGTVPAPGIRSLGRRTFDQPAPELRPARPPVEDGRPQAGERRPEGRQVPERLEPGEQDRRKAPPPHTTKTPKSTGEPELRRRRP